MPLHEARELPLLDITNLIEYLDAKVEIENLKQHHVEKQKAKQQLK